MKRLLFFFFIPIIFYAQFKPDKFEFSESDFRKSTNSQLDNTPLSNSINDILTIGDTVWVATSKGLSVTFNGGNSWNNFYGTEPFGTESAIALAYSKGILFCTTGHYETGYDGNPVITGSGLRFTTDKGNSWISVPQSLDLPGDSLITYGINTLRALPITVPQQNVSYDIAILKDTVFTTSWAGGLRKVSVNALLTNPETQWERVVLPPDYLDSISPNDTLDFSLQPQAGAFGPEHYLNHVAFSVVSTDSGYLYVGTANGINKSEDGISWRKFNYQNQIEGISGNFITSLGYDKKTKSIWATTWPAVDNNEYYAISATFNGGESWNIFLDDEKGHGFGFLNNSSESEIFVATDNGIFRTTNNGYDWFTPIIIKDSETGIFFDNFVKYYSCDADFNSENIKSIWVGSSQGLAKETEASGDDIWDGIWKLYIASQSLANNNETYAFPNPFNPNLRQVKIKYEIIDETNDVTIRIFNFNMQIVRTLIQNVSRNKGENLEVWDGKDESGGFVPNGVYFYVIERGNSDKIFGKIMVLQ